MKTLAAAAASAGLLAIAGLHAHWALGGTWPERSREALAKLVVGGRPLPGPGPCVAVALLIIVAVGATQLASVGAGGPVVRLVALGAGAVLLLRGVAGPVINAGLPSVRVLPFGRANLWIFSPLSAGLGLLILLAAR